MKGKGSCGYYNGLWMGDVANIVTNGVLTSASITHRLHNCQLNRIKHWSILKLVVNKKNLSGLLKEYNNTPYLCSSLAERHVPYLEGLLNLQSPDRNGLCLCLVKYNVVFPIWPHLQQTRLFIIRFFVLCVL